MTLRIHTITPSGEREEVHSARVTAFLAGVQAPIHTGMSNCASMTFCSHDYRVEVRASDLVLAFRFLLRVDDMPTRWARTLDGTYVRDGYHLERFRGRAGE